MPNPLNAAIPATAVLVIDPEPAPRPSPPDTATETIATALEPAVMVLPAES